MAKYTELNDGQLAAVLAGYGVHHVDASLLDGGAANTSYRVQSTAGETYILTVLDNANNLGADALARLLQHVSEHGVVSTVPVPNAAGELVSSLDDHRVLLKHFVDGVCYDVMPLEHVHASGAALACIHNAPVPEWLPVGTRRLGDVSEQLRQFEDADFATWVAKHLQNAQPLFDLDAPQCIVHGDFFADNLVVKDDGSIAVLDWETASVDTATMDIGFAVVGLACVDGELDMTRANALVQGYENKRTLTHEEQALLKNAVMYAGVRSAYFRYVRQHIWYPNPAKFDIYKEMQRFVESVEDRWVP